MKTNKQKTNWILDAVLATAFWLTFFLDLTGLALHQWLGVAVGVLAAYHLLVHWDWVTTVTRRLLRPTAVRAQLYYLIDAGLMLGLGLVVVSGLVISTWLSLPLGNYATWKNLHVWASIVTLLILVLKLALHWRWIAGVARRYIFAPPAGRVPTPQPVTTSANLDRREFLKWMGVMSAAGVLAVGNALKDSGAVLTNSGAVLTNSGAVLTNSGAVLTNSDTSPVNESSTGEANANSSGSGLPATPTSTACTVRCNRGCSYPGHCHRYTDSNNNNRCDWGECI